MSRQFVILLAVVFLFTACQRDETENSVTITSCADAPIGLASATAFTLNSKAYIFGGRKDEKSNYNNDMYCFDPQENSWSKVASYPLKDRVNAAAITVNNTVYLGLGFSGTPFHTENYHQDWWSFDGNNWKQLADYPIYDTDGVITFYEDGYIYGILGFYNSFQRKVYCYSIADDEWHIADYKLPVKMTSTLGAVGATCCNRHFAGTGYYPIQDYNEWYEFMPSIGSFEMREAIPSYSRCLATCSATKENIYVIGGRHWGDSSTKGRLTDEIWEYQIHEDKWHLKGHLPQAAENMISFTINDTIYVGLGENSQGERLKTLYKIEK